MNKKQAYRQLADNVFQRAAEEEEVVLSAQWRILGTRYLELASGVSEEKDPVFDPIPWDRQG